jgi:methanogenic corrinoid protein MtbC1
VARRAAAREVDPVAAAKVTTDVDTVELVRLLLTSEDGGGLAFVETLVLRGATPEALYMGVLPASARRLGELWEEDRCDFSQVTIALGRLQQVARMLSPRFQAASVSQSDAVSLLLLPAPGEQHTFGLLILAEFFQRAGWRVAGGPKSSMADAAELARHQWFDVAGFSIGSERLLDSLAKTIRAVRRASRNRNIGVMVGGPLFQHRPELVALAGADAMALDAPGAVRLATGLLTMRAMAG